MTQLQSAPAASCDTLLRQGRELLNKGELAPASARGWQAASRAMSDYVDADFTDAARELVVDYRGHTDAAEWVVSALALRDNAEYDWLDRDGVARRLDDVQRLAILVKDINEPPQSADDVLRRAWECMDNGYLIPASDKGWEAALLATKTYADAIGCRYKDESHFDSVMRILQKAEAGSREVGTWTYAAANLRRTAAYCAGRNDPRYAELVAEDIGEVGKLVSFIQESITWLGE